ncbi:Protein kinase-like domain [Pseudocohnilembus persalinus]|uniref:Protein kinase-like domain n=1 Tax=Pseudocohnilembus persalinus TaxID=266149 RepID=A0A0V0QVB0_PSEPJ|nr:Protein kinase-like domain [Pseudocohnilembus persalinus]|eukprot:KRX06271.1 Protein kinase-like domain [Pseudocohnilembus persalinus]
MPATSTCKARSIMILHFIFSLAWTLLGIQTLMVSIDYLDNDKYEIMDTDITQEVYNWPVISLNYFSLDSEQTTNILAVIYGCIILISGIVAVLLTCWTRIFALRHLQYLKSQNYIQQNFEVNWEKSLGSEGNDQVYQAESKPPNGKKLAIKNIVIKNDDHPQFQTQILAEINAKKFQNHQNITKSQEIFYTKLDDLGQYNIFVVMERGFTDLQKVIENKYLYKTNYLPDQLIQLILQIFEGLQHMHTKNNECQKRQLKLHQIDILEKDFYHKDIKPENILIFKQDNQLILKLADFGTNIQNFKDYCLFSREFGTSAYLPKEIKTASIDDKINLQKVDIYSAALSALMLASHPCINPEDIRNFAKSSHCDWNWNKIFQNGQNEQNIEIIQYLLKAVDKDPRKRPSISEIIKKMKSIKVSKKKYDFMDGQFFGYLDVLNRKQNYGTFIYENGSKYEGNFENDLKNGYGKQTYLNGTYEGNWVKNQKNGHGKFTWLNNDTYIGQWVNDQKEGQGEIIYNTQEKYQGQFKQNEFHGIGKFTHQNGSYYFGNWDRGLKHGNGFFFENEENQYIGEWYYGDLDHLLKSKEHHKPAAIHIQSNIYLNQIYVYVLYFS